MKDYPFFDEEKFGEAYREYLAQKNPNPERIGCPDTNVIRDIAFRRKVAPEICRKVISHMMKCSECVCDAIEYADEYKAGISAANLK
jgi:hypothetical protein